VVERAAGRALTTEEKDAVEAALHYFRVGGERHNADEEESLFPRLRAARGDDEAVQHLDVLEDEHVQAGKLHTAVEELYRKWIMTDTLAQLEQEQLLLATARLRRLYTDHIQVEEQTVFPRAAELLDTAALVAIGAEFKARRQ